MATLPTIQAIADEAGLSFAERVTRIKQSFGIPRWITRNFSRPGETRRGPVRTLNTVPTVPGHPNPYVGNIERLSKSSLNREHARNESVLAHVHIADLSKPAPSTTKSQILAWMETPVDRIAHISEVFAAFPEVARNGISSRLSELVKSGQLISLGRGSATYQLPTA